MRLLIFILLFSTACQGQVIRANPFYRSTASGCTPDADATAFITATGITGTDATAICNLVASLKSASLWSKFQAIYPMVGGTSTSCKYNLIDPADTDAAFRLTFNGGWTFSSTGADPNGTTGYAQTHIVPSTDLTTNNFHLSYYSRQSVTGVQELMASFNVAAQNIQFIINNASTGDLTMDSYISPTTRVEGNGTNTTGYLLGSRTASNAAAVYKNGSSLNTVTGGGGTTPSIEIFLAAANVSGSPTLFASCECAFATIGEGLTSFEITTLNTIVEAFQDALGRGVQ